MITIGTSSKNVQKEIDLGRSFDLEMGRRSCHAIRIQEQVYEIKSGLLQHLP